MLWSTYLRVPHLPILTHFYEKQKDQPTMFKKKLPQVVHTKITLKKRALGKKKFARLLENNLTFEKKLKVKTTLHLLLFD